MVKAPVSPTRTKIDPKGTGLATAERWAVPSENLGALVVGILAPERRTDIARLTGSSPETI
jgi:hypothetical protein